MHNVPFSSHRRRRWREVSRRSSSPRCNTSTGSPAWTRTRQRHRMSVRGESDTQHSPKGLEFSCETSVLAIVQANSCFWEWTQPNETLDTFLHMSFYAAAAVAGLKKIKILIAGGINSGSDLWCYKKLSSQLCASFVLLIIIPWTVWFIGSRFFITFGCLYYFKPHFCFAEKSKTLKRGKLVPITHSNSRVLNR